MAKKTVKYMGIVRCTEQEEKLWDDTVQEKKVTKSEVIREAMNQYCKKYMGGEKWKN